MSRRDEDEDEGARLGWNRAWAGANATTILQCAKARRSLSRGRFLYLEA